MSSDEQPNGCPTTRGLALLDICGPSYVQPRLRWYVALGHSDLVWVLLRSVGMKPTSSWGCCVACVLGWGWGGDVVLKPIILRGRCVGRRLKQTWSRSLYTLILDALKHDVQLMTDYKNALWDMKPSAKLVDTRAEQEHILGNNSMATVTCWRHDNDLYYTTQFQRYGIRFQNGRLIVPVSGTYYIYSFLGLAERRLTDDGVPIEPNNMH
ncbi:hypothetical protein MAR_013404 [Mya arenaria]|uniref:THD domain-containing protein n=1 Tax=Mya arenaria TaxID=6604 RepID=A0ABY7FZR0_MYAAR|nr:hypothetical protein MAR_013404 [Mya arenaria]